MPYYKIKIRQVQVFGDFAIFPKSETDEWRLKDHDDFRHFYAP